MERVHILSEELQCLIPGLNLTRHLLLPDRIQNLPDFGAWWIPKGHHIVAGDQRRRMDNVLLVEQLQNSETVNFYHIVPWNRKYPTARFLISECEHDEKRRIVSNLVDQPFESRLFCFTGQVEDPHMILDEAKDLKAHRIRESEPFQDLFGGPTREGFVMIEVNSPPLILGVRILLADVMEKSRIVERETILL